MFEIVGNEVLAPQVHRLVVRAPRVAAARRPGQFVIVHCTENAERIPLTIADADPDSGTITLIVQAVGPGTEEIIATPAGGTIRDLAGPLGRVTHMEKWGKVVCVGGGVGTAVLYPLAKALAQGGNEVITIIGARSEQFVILRRELGEFSREVLVATEDGSVGTRGLVTVVLGDLLENSSQSSPRPDAVFAVGPVGMMAAVSEQTRPHGIKTIVSLNPIMVDGTGMCGGCRVTVDGQIRFACVDGPEFDGHLVDFKELAARRNTYTDNQHCRLGQHPDTSPSENAE